MKVSAWKGLWEKRSADIEHCQNSEKALFLELKRSNGFDVIGDGLSYEALLEQYENIKARLFDGMEKNICECSVYEVGCGSGATFFFIQKDGTTCGGLGYSSNLIGSAKKVLHTEDIICAEANQLPKEPIYDALLSNSVFSYFADEEYAYTVLERMYQKTRYSIGLIDIHDSEKEEDFVAYRKQTIEDYEERYRNLPKLFYTKSFFQKFAENHDMRIVFTDSKMQGYWNNGFVFNCFMYKNSGGK